MRVSVCAFWSGTVAKVSLFMAAYAAAGLLLGSCAWQRTCLAQAQAVALARPASIQPDSHIYTWIGNAPAWDKKLHVSGYRLGCDDGNPQGCVSEAAEAVQQEGLASVFLSMPVDKDRTPGDAREYSRLSATHPFIAEAGFDDFVGRYGKLFLRLGVDPPSWLRTVVRNVKAENPHLAFGITLYEDELDSPFVRPPGLPPDLARSVGYVHLFLHYRADAPRFPENVEQAKRLFPNAKIIAGLYAYDRIDYIPCSPQSQRPCAPGEEIQLYKQALDIDARLLKEGSIAGIEFYPGFFGKENEWGGWRQPDYCSPQRVAECIQNTRAMRDSTAKTLGAVMEWK